ncbi:MAG: hypothetical protein MJZ74_04355 [Muribaculaceae bacterium]|nr:hypothetical protein [Muribaculaceae bacterium]
MANFKNILLKILGADEQQEPQQEVQPEVQPKPVQPKPVPKPAPEPEPDDDDTITVIDDNGENTIIAPAPKTELPEPEPETEIETETEIEPEPETEIEPEPEAKIATKPVAQPEPQVTVAPQPQVIETPQPEPAVVRPTYTFRDAISAEKDIINMAFKALKKKFAGNRHVGKTVLHIFIEHPEIIAVLNEDIAEGVITHKLAEKFDIELGIKFARIEMTTQRNDALSYIEVEPGTMHYATTLLDAPKPGTKPDTGTTEPPKPKHMRATMRVLEREGYGSLMQDVYELDSEQIYAMPRHRCNVGAGKSHKTANGTHTNHIAIDDNAQSPEYENNKYVSRTHAHIGFLPSKGFVLYGNARGLRMAQKRTQIIRDNIIEVNSTTMPYQLLDGDVIVLSKHVSLLFNIIKD